MVEQEQFGPAILAAAESVNSRTQRTPYVFGGKSEAGGFDCSYFVYLALHAADSGYTYLSSINIANNLAFSPVDGNPLPGDIIYFSPGKVPYDGSRGVGHVAVVSDPGPPVQFVGKQSHAGDGHVSMTNPYWGSRPHRFFRYVGNP